MGIIGIISGIVIIIFLFKWYKQVAAGLIGVGASTVLAGAVCYIPVHMPVYALYLIFCTFLLTLVFSLAAGAAAAFLVVTRLPHLAKFLIGATGGLLLAVLINPLGPAYALYYLFFPIAVVLAVGGAVFGKMKFRIAYVFTTSFLAAYLVIRGISAFPRNYPSSIEFYREHKEGEIKVLA